jgi:hypothetical protein
MEYLLVIFPESRRVIVDGFDLGQETGEVIELEAGTHIITLGGPADFQPPERVVTLENTSVLEPLEVQFDKRI